MSVFEKFNEMMGRFDETMDSIFGTSEDRGAEEPKSTSTRRYRVIRDDDVLGIELDLPGATDIEATASVSDLLVTWRRGEKKGRFVLRFSDRVSLAETPSAAYVDGVLQMFFRKSAPTEDRVKIPIGRVASPPAGA